MVYNIYCDFNSNILFLLFSVFQRSLPFEFLKYDPETYEPVRTDKGRCVKVNKGKKSNFM